MNVDPSFLSVWKVKESDPFKESLQSIATIAKETLVFHPHSTELNADVSDVPSEAQKLLDLKEILDLERQIVDLKRTINEQELLKEAGCLRDGLLFEKRNEALESLLAHLEQIETVGDRLVRQLQNLASNSDSSSKFYVHRSQHKDVCEVFDRMSSFLTDLETNLRTLSSMGSVDLDLDKDLPLPDTKFSRLCSLCLLIERLRNVFRAMTEGKEKL